MSDIALGENIRLVGFRELEPAKLIVVKKMVGNYARKMKDQVAPVQELSLTLKEVHHGENEKKKKYEVMGKVLYEKHHPANAEVIDFNLFFAIDKVLQKLLHEK